MPLECLRQNGIRVIRKEFGRFNEIMSFEERMQGQSSYVPPPYIPLGKSDLEAEIDPRSSDDTPFVQHQTSVGPAQWSSGICACFDDIQSCCEAPCGDFATHLFCHLCAICQEYREIRERSIESNPHFDLVEISAPTIQTMESASTQ